MSIYILGTNQSPKLPTGFINSAGGDVAPGVPLSSAQASGSIIQPYYGQVGGKLSLDTTEAPSLSDPAQFPLFAGVYQYVLFLSTSVAANARGQVVFWSNRPAYVVTPDVTTATQGLIAGITLATITRGNYGWIQIAGRASVRFKTAALGAASPAAGDLLIVDQAPTNTVDDPSQATALTPTQDKSKLGTAAVVPVSGSVLAIDLAFFDTGWSY